MFDPITYNTVLSTGTGLLNFTSSIGSGILNKIGTNGDAAAMNTTLFAGQQAIYDDVHGIISLGGELVTNGNFAAWTGDDPDGWTVGGETDENNKVTENSGACRIYAVANHVFVQQSILTVGKYYYYSITVTDVTSGTLVLWDSTEVLSISAAGTYTGYFKAKGTDFLVSRYTNPCDITFDNVSVKEVFLPSSSVPSQNATANTTIADVIGNKTDTAVEAVGTTKAIIAYLKGLVQLLDQLSGTDVITIVATTSSTLSDVVNISDKGVLTGITMVSIGADYGTLKVTIDGSVIHTDSIAITANVAGCSTTLNLFHRFNSSLRVEHRNNGNSVAINTTVCYTIDA